MGEGGGGGGGGTFIGLDSDIAAVRQGDKWG